jgi:hypothetical protein
MKNKPLPELKYLQECFDYNRETGELFWKVRPMHHFVDLGTYKSWNSRFSGKRISYISSVGYYAVRINESRYQVHRIIWKLEHSEDPSELIDHKDGNKLNNRITNLREATHQENNRNVNARNIIGVKGVTFRKNKGDYQVNITLDRKTYHLGLFETIEEASLAYQKASLEHYGEFGKF